MAEHEEIVRKAAEAVNSAVGTAYPSAHHRQRIRKVSGILAPFFLRARKEAREGALTIVIERDEADQIVVGSEEVACYGVGQTIREALLDYLSQLADYRAELDGASLGPALERERDLLEGLEPRALRSKPEEPASDPADQLLRSIAEQSKAPCPTGGKHIFTVTLDDHCIETIKRLTLAPEANETEARAAATDYRNRATGERIAWSAPPGELILTACAKCGIPGIVDLGWRTQPKEPA